MTFSDKFQAKVRELFPHSAHVVGAGVEGLSTVAFLKAAGVETIVLRDRNASLKAPEGVSVIAGDGYLDGIPVQATVMRSAGIRPDLPAFLAHRATGGKVLSQLRLFLALYRVLHPNGRVVGVTATMGKGTICTILSGMLSEAGMPHALLGNIGKAMLDVFLEADVPETVILELSSFQLSDLGPGDGLAVADCAVDVGLFGRVTLEHLDWHKDQIEYWNAKANLANWLTDDQWAVYLANEPGSVFGGMAGDALGRTLGEGGELEVRDNALCEGDIRLLELSDLKVPGVFQLENTGLAWLAARCLELSEDAILRGAKAFAGLRHRLMWAGEAEGIRYYNDSYATRPEATLAAVDALASAPLALVLGGSDKNIDFTELAAGLLACPSLVHISLIGATAGRLREALTAAGVPPFALLEYPGLDPAFEACEQAVRGTGGAVLLSPACASFGLFANYKERGEAFLKLAAARTGISY
ncbi:MAG: hypothetical protein RL318_1102 [Fibrobacterota bacterium]|jgi:UDP-N-acetylmuramoylalanine--D-glutamate ligase